MSSSIGSYALQAPVAQFQRQQPPQLFTLPGQMHGVASVVSDGQGANFSLGAMAAALPGYRLPAFDPSPGHPQFHPSHSPTTMRQNQQQSSYFAGQSGYNSQAYNLGLSSHLPPYLQAQQESNQYSQQQHQQHHGQHSPMQQQYPGLPFYGGQQLASPQYALFPPYYRPINPSPPDFQGESAKSSWPQANRAHSHTKVFRDSKKVVPWVE